MQRQQQQQQRRPGSDLAGSVCHRCTLQRRELDLAPCPVCRQRVCLLCRVQVRPDAPCYACATPAALPDHESCRHATLATQDARLFDCGVCEHTGCDACEAESGSGICSRCMRLGGSSRAKRCGVCGRDAPAPSHECAACRRLVCDRHFGGVGGTSRVCTQCASLETYLLDQQDLPFLAQELDVHVVVAFSSNTVRRRMLSVMTRVRAEAPDPATGHQRLLGSLPGPVHVLLLHVAGGHEPSTCASVAEPTLAVMQDTMSRADVAVAAWLRSCDFESPASPPYGVPCLDAVLRVLPRGVAVDGVALAQDADVRTFAPPAVSLGFFSMTFCDTETDEQAIIRVCLQLQRLAAGPVLRHLHLSQTLAVHTTCRGEQALLDVLERSRSTLRSVHVLFSPWHVMMLQGSGGEDTLLRKMMAVLLRMPVLESVTLYTVLPLPRLQLHSSSSSSSMSGGVARVRDQDTGADIPWPPWPRLTRLRICWLGAGTDSQPALALLLSHVAPRLRRLTGSLMPVTNVMATVLLRCKVLTHLEVGSLDADVKPVLRWSAWPRLQVVHGVYMSSAHVSNLPPRVRRVKLWTTGAAKVTLDVSQLHALQRLECDHFPDAPMSRLTMLELRQPLPAALQQSGAVLAALPSLHELSLTRAGTLRVLPFHTPQLRQLTLAEVDAVSARVLARALCAMPLLAALTLDSVRVEQLERDSARELDAALRSLTHMQRVQMERVTCDLGRLLPLPLDAWPLLMQARVPHAPVWLNSRLYTCATLPGRGALDQVSYAALWCDDGWSMPGARAALRAVSRRRMRALLERDDADSEEDEEGDASPHRGTSNSSGGEDDVIECCRLVLESGATPLLPPDPRHTLRLRSCSPALRVLSVSLLDHAGLLHQLPSRLTSLTLAGTRLTGHGAWALADTLAHLSCLRAFAVGDSLPGPHARLLLQAVSLLPHVRRVTLSAADALMADPMLMSKRMPPYLHLNVRQITATRHIDGALVRMTLPRVQRLTDLAGALVLTTPSLCALAHTLPREVSMLRLVSRAKRCECCDTVFLGAAHPALLPRADLHAQARWLAGVQGSHHAGYQWTWHRPACGVPRVPRVTCLGPDMLHEWTAMLDLMHADIV